MTGRIDKTYKSPVVVDERFLRRLDETINHSVTLLIDDIAVKHDVEPDRLRIYLAKGKVPTNIKNHHRYQAAIDNAKLTYTVKWRNDLSEELSDISSVIKALNSEHALPYSIRASMGYFTKPSISFDLRSNFEEIARLEVSGNRNSVRNISEKFGSLIKTSQPDFSFLHHPFLKLALLIIFLAINLAIAFNFNSIFSFREIASFSKFIGIMGWIGLAQALGSGPINGIHIGVGL